MSKYCLKSHFFFFSPNLRIRFSVRVIHLESFEILESLGPAALNKNNQMTKTKDGMMLDDLFRRD